MAAANHAPGQSRSFDENEKENQQAGGVGSSSWQDPRTILVHRKEGGFGFVLRHFIVYPPDSSQECERSGGPVDDPHQSKRTRLSQQEPMDTIFVMHVKEGSPASLAGLQEGDRILSVNGQSVAGQSYSQVIGLIQSSDSTLRLLVVPRNEDILQVAYQSSAYNQGLDAFRGSASNIPQPPETAVVPQPSKPPDPPPKPSRFRSEVRFASIDKDVDDDEEIQAVEEPQCYSAAPTMTLHSGSISSYDSSVDSQLSPAYLQDNNSERIYTSSVTWPRRGSKTEEPTYRSSVSNGPPAPVRTTSKNISLSHLQRLENRSGSLESISKSSKSSSDSSGSQNVILRRPDSDENLHNQDASSAPSNRESSNRWSSPESQRGIQEYKASLRKSQEDLFGASRGKPVAVLSKSVTTGQLQVAGVSSAPTSPSRPTIPYTKSHTTSSLLNRNKYFDLQGDEAMGVTVPVPTTQTYTTSTYVTTTGSSNTVATTSVTINPVGIRYRPAYSGKLPEPPTKPQIIIRRRKSYDNILDDSAQNKGPLHKIHETLRSDSNLLPQPHRIPVKVQDSSLPSHVMKIEKFHGAGGLSVTVKSAPVQTIQDTQTPGSTIVSQRLRQFEVGSYDSLPSHESVKHQFELRKLSTSAQVDSVAQKAAKFENTNSDQSKKVSIHIRKNFDNVRQPFDSCNFPTPYSKPYIQEPPPKTPAVDLRTETPKFIIAPSYESSKRITMGPGWDNRSKSTGFLMEDTSYLDGGHGLSYTRPQQSFSVLHTNTDRSKFARQSSEERSPHLYTQSESSMFTTSHSMCNMSSSSSSTSTLISNVPKVEHESALSPDGSPTSPPGANQAFSTVTLRTKPKEDDSDVKLFRRISYLKATAKDRGHLNLPVETTYDHDEPDADQNLADQPTTPTKTSMRKLKLFFGEKTPKILEATEKRPLFSDLPTPPGDVTKEGILTCKLALVDGKRASDRSWKQVWAALSGHNLYFCREKKDSQTSTQVVCDEFPVNIKGCTVDIAHGYTKKKHVIRLCTQNNCEYLLHADDHDTMLSWINAIQASSSNDDEEDQVLKSQAHLIVKKSGHHDHHQSYLRTSPLVQPKSTVKKIAALSFRAKSPGHSPGIRPRKDESPKVKEMKEIKTWKGKVVKSFKRLGSASDTLALTHMEHDLDETEEDLRQTFGVPLGLCLPSTFNENVPLVIELCTTIIEAKGLEYTGIYRIPGNSATVSMLQDELNKGLDQVNVENEKWLDVNAVGSLLKSFLRQLPEPLITYELYDVFIQANRNDNPEKRMLNLKRLLHELPEPHFETFKHLAHHLKTVSQHGNFNKMDAKNLAIVFGPTLIRNTSEDRVAMVADMSDQCRIIESIIHHNDWFFSSWEDDNEIPLDEPDDHPPSAVTQTVVAEDESGLNLKELVANIVQAANKKLQEREMKEATEGRKDKSITFESIFGERNIDEEVAKRKNKIQVEASSTVTTTTTSSETESRKCEMSTREGIFTAKMVFLQGRQCSESSLRTDSEDILSDPGMVSSQSTQSFTAGRYRLQNPTVSGFLGLGNRDSQFSRRHSEEIVIDRRPSPDNRASSSSFEAAILQNEERWHKEAAKLQKAKSECQASEKRVLDKQWVEKELQKTQEELEEDEDCLEDFIGNTNKISRKISDFTSRMDPGGRADSLSITSDYSTMSSTKEAPPIGSLSDYSSNASPTSRQPVLPLPPDKNRSHSLTNLNNSSQTFNPDFKGGKFFAVKIKPVLQDSSTNKNTQLKLPVDSEQPVAGRSRKGRTVNWKVGGDDSSPDDIKADKCTLSRTGSLRRGSLDSLRDFYEKNEFTASFASSSSEDGCDLLTSLTTTFDQKLRILLDPKYKLETSASGIVGCVKGDNAVQKAKDMNSNSLNMDEKGDGPRPKAFRDPSLHRLMSDTKVGIASRFERPDQKPELPPEGAMQKSKIPPGGQKTRMGKVKAFVTKYERSDSLLKPNESSTADSSQGAISVISKKQDPCRTTEKSKSASPPVRRKNSASLRRRRHTVGGIRDFEDVMTMIREQSPQRKTSAWDRLQPGGKTTASLSCQERTVQTWIQQERLRSSSSDVSQESSTDGRGSKRNDGGV